MENKKKCPSSHVKAVKDLRIYSWYSLPDFKHDQKRFICILLLNIPEMRPLGTFKFYRTVSMETMTITKISTLVLAVHLQVLHCAKFQ